MFLRYVMKVDKRELLRLFFEHIYMLLLCLIFPGKLPLCGQSEKFWAISIIWPPGSGSFKMFLRYVNKGDKRELLRLFFEHIYMLLLFPGFPGKLPLCDQSEEFGSYPSFDPLDQAHLKCFWDMSSKLIKEKYSRYILSIFICFCCFQFFQENYPYAIKVKNFGSYPSFGPLDQAHLRCFRNMSSKLI